MTQDERNFMKKKANLILNLMDSNFFDKMYDELKTRQFDSLDALDSFVNKALSEYIEQKQQIRLYYDEKIGPDPEEDEENFDEDDS
jgi:hypothetical protein